MATNSNDPALGAGGGTKPPPPPPIVKKDPPKTALEKLEALDEVRRQMVLAKHEAAPPLGVISNARSGTAAERENAYQPLYSAVSRFYGALRSGVSVGRPIEHPTLGVGPIPATELTKAEKDVAELPNLGLTPETSGGEGAAIKEIIGKKSVYAWFRNALGGKSYYGSEHELGGDRLIAQKLDKERKKLKDQLKEDLKEAQKNNDQAQIAAIRAYMAKPEYLGLGNFDSLVSDMNDELGACDKHMLERIRRGLMIGWTMASEHDIQRKKNAHLFAIFDWGGCKVEAHINNRGNPVAHVSRIPMFSRVGAFFCMGQLLGSLQEQIIYQLPLYKLDANGNVEKDGNGNLVTEKDTDGNTIYRFGSQAKSSDDQRKRQQPLEDAYKTPIEISGLPGGWAGQAVNALWDQIIWAQKLGASIAGVQYDDKGVVTGFDDGFLESVSSGMDPGAKASFLVYMRGGTWKADYEDANKMFEKEVVDPYFENLAEQELIKQGVGRLGRAWKRSERAAEIKHEMMVGGPPPKPLKSKDEAQAVTHFIARQAVEKMGGHKAKGPEVQKIEEKEEEGLEIHATSKVPGASNISASAPGGAGSASAAGAAVGGSAAATAAGGSAVTTPFSTDSDNTRVGTKATSSAVATSFNEAEAEEEEATKTTTKVKVESGTKNKGKKLD